MTTELPELEFEVSGGVELVDAEEIGVALEPVAGVGLLVEGSTEGVDAGAWELEDMRMEKERFVVKRERAGERITKRGGWRAPGEGSKLFLRGTTGD